MSEIVTLPVGSWNVIYADPPWPMRYALRPWGKEQVNALPYPTMGVEDIKGMAVKDIAANDSWLFLWVINKYVEESYSVARAWGFRPVTLLTWCKTPRGLGLGGNFTQTTEHILFAKRGILRGAWKIDSTWFTSKRNLRHSEKPSFVRDTITSVAPPNATKIELFARERVPGWDAWGNEV